MIVELEKWKAVVGSGGGVVLEGIIFFQNIEKLKVILGK